MRGCGRGAETEQGSGRPGGGRGSDGDTAGAAGTGWMEAVPLGWPTALAGIGRCWAAWRVPPLSLDAGGGLGEAPGAGVRLFLMFSVNILLSVEFPGGKVG